MANDRNNVAGKWVRLRVSKRVVRLPDTSQCIDQPSDVPLPRPKIRMNFDAVRYLKSIPKFRPDFIVRGYFNGLHSRQTHDLHDSSYSDGEDDKVTALSHRVSSMNLSDSSQSSDSIVEYDPLEITSDFIHYCLFIFHGIYDPHKILQLIARNEFKARILMLNYFVKEAFLLCLSTAKTAVQSSRENDQSDTNTDDRPNEESPFDSLDSDHLTNYVIKLFEYFTKDANIVPIHRTDLKYLIHAIFMYFIKNALPLDSIETYFLANIDHYLFGLAYVLYFNNNNTKLEQQVQQKYNHLFSGCAPTSNKLINICGGGGNEPRTNCDGNSDEQNPSDDEMALDFEVIFRNVSTSFKTTICQRLIEFDNDLN